MTHIDPAAPFSQDSALAFSRIMDAASNLTGISADIIRSPSQLRSVVEVRQMVMWLARLLLNMSFPEIARACGDMHHSTALRSVRKVEQRRQRDADFARLCDEAMRQCRMHISLPG